MTVMKRITVITMTGITIYVDRRGTGITAWGN